MEATANPAVASIIRMDKITLEQAIAWCIAHHAQVNWTIYGYVEVTIRTYPSLRAETLEQAVTALQEIEQERNAQRGG